MDWKKKYFRIHKHNILCLSKCTEEMNVSFEHKVSIRSKVRLIILDANFVYLFLVCWVGYQILISNVNSLVRKEEAVAVAWLRYPEPILLLTICGVLWCFHRKVMKLATRSNREPSSKEKWFMILWFPLLCLWPKSCTKYTLLLL